SIAGQRVDWRTCRVPARAASLNQPLIAFQSEPHAGGPGPSISLLSITDPNNQVAVRALKKAEDSDEIVLRVQELYGRPARTPIKFALPIRSVREINAAEESVGPVTTSSGNLVVDLKPYQPRTFALRLQTPIDQFRGVHASVQIDLPYNLDGISTDANRSDGNFDGKGQTLAGELLPPELSLNGVQFKFGSSAPGALNVLVPRGETVALPQGPYNRVYILAA